MDWIAYALALTAFLAAHIVPMRPAIRARLIGRLGRTGYFLGFSVLSLLLLYLVILTAAQAPFIPLWPAQHWQRWLANLVMPLALILITGGLPHLRHPLLLGFTLWAGVHLLANGDLAHVIFFGLMALFAGLGMVRPASKPVKAPMIRWSRVGLAVAIWAGLIALHPYVIGVSPLP